MGIDANIQEGSGVGFLFFYLFAGVSVVLLLKKTIFVVRGKNDYSF